MTSCLLGRCFEFAFTLRSSIYIGLIAAGPIDMHAANDLPIERHE